MRKGVLECSSYRSLGFRGDSILTPAFRAWAAQRPSHLRQAQRAPFWAAALTRGGLGSIAECGATCESCFSQDFCIQCKRRFYLYKGKCLPTCPLGTAAQPSTRECQGEWGLSHLPPSLQGLERGVRRPRRTTGECHVVLGGPTGDIRYTQGPFNSLEPS